MIDTITDFVGNAIGTIFPSRSASVLKKISPYVEKINALEPKYARLDDAGLRGKTDEFRKRIAELRAADPKADENGKVERYLDEILPEAFALVREAGKRVLGMRHFDVQLIGGMVLHGLGSPIKTGLNRGMISEMVTGEGKTLVATLPSYLNALPRRPDEYANVYVVTVNDYLAKRDAEWNRPLFEVLGMSCGAIQSNMDSWDRHPVYASDIVYGTNSEFGFDYLRDNMKMDAEKQVQKVRRFAIVDEVDSILIDEARTPLIISGSPDEEVGERYMQAAKLAQHLKPTPDEEKDRIEELRLHGQFEDPKSGHYIVDEKDHTVTLTAEGIRECERYLQIENFYTGAHMEWPHFIDNALKAKELYKKDTHYVVGPGRDGKLEVVIVDEFTGRQMYGRRWSDGLHQAVEAKEVLFGEAIQMEAESQTLATITIQNYFKLFNKLAGMTGTALTESREFGQIYKLEVVSIPTNRPMRRLNFPDVIYGTEKEKWEAICQEIEDVHATGRPILVGTTSVEKSEVLAGMLERRGMRGKFEVLNAKQHAREAVIVAKAGQLGAITVATNMAGRGTDILLGRFTLADLVEHWRKLGLAPDNFDTNRPLPQIEEHLIGYWLKQVNEEVFKKTETSKRKAALEKAWADNHRSPLRLATTVKDLGGVHIIGSERHEARRIDNQLRGRSGRQGDPGSSRFFLCLDDDLMRIFAKDWVRNFLRASGMKDGVPLESRMVSRSIEKAQRRVEEHHFGTRKRLLEYDEVMNEQRKLVYSLRQKVLESRELKETMLEWVEDVIALAVDREIPDDSPTPEGLHGLTSWLKRKFLVEMTPQEFTHKSKNEIEDIIITQVKKTYDEKDAALGETEVPREKSIRYTPLELKLPPEQLAEVVRRKMGEILEVPPEKIEFDIGRIEAGMVPNEVRVPVKERKMRLLERFLMLDIIDTKWKDHLHNMDTLREGIYLRGYAQKDPKLEYKREGFEHFQDMFTSMKEQASDLILKAQVSAEVEKQEVASVWNEDEAQTIHQEASSAFGGGGEGAAVGGGSAEMAAESEHGGEKLKPVETIRKGGHELQPNAPCPCGSGKKYKKCHGRGGSDLSSPLPSRGGGREHKGEVKTGG
jgi:preprotein translocase subunit SecA